MLLRTFPSDHFPVPKETNTIVHTFSHNTLYQARSGPLCFIFAFGGRAYIIVDSAELPVDDGGFAVLNSGQTYACRVPKGPETELLCLYFADDFARQALDRLEQPGDRLLFDPVAPPSQLLFFDRRYSYSPAISRRIEHVRRSTANRQHGQSWIDRRLISILEAFLPIHRGLEVEIARLDAKRPSTRGELYRRLCHARDVIESSYHRNLTITSLADVAHLSPHHFIRRFKQLFRETPHQMLRRRRLDEACRLLREHNGNIADICRQVGFESTGSFTRLFGSVYGLAPDQWRRRRRQ